MFDTLPGLTFDEIEVEATDVPRAKWEQLFPKYTATAFHAEIDRQTRMVETLVHDIGANTADGLKILEGLESRVGLMREWHGLQKVPALARLLVSENHEKLVVLGTHKSVVHEMRWELRQWNPVGIHAPMNKQQTRAAVKRFQTDPAYRVFLGDIRAVGALTDLTAAHEVVAVEADWIVRHNAIAVMRVHRSGQNKDVRVRFVSLKGTIDQPITRVLKNRTRALLNAFDDGKTFY